MKVLIVYSSQTGNTRKLAQTICEALPTGALMCTVDKVPDPAACDFVAVGFWLRAGKPDPTPTGFLERLKGHPNVFLFATHGARPDSEHAKHALACARSLAEGATVSGTFSCFGEVNPNVLEKATAKPQPPVWIDDAAHAVGHPDQRDIQLLSESLVAAMG